MGDGNGNATSRYWLDDQGIVRGQSAEGAVYALEDAQHAIAEIRRLAAGTPRCLLIDITGVASMTREARAHFGSPGHREFALAVALVTAAPISRAIGNFFLGLNKPVVPLKLFGDVEKARAWLEPFQRPEPRT